MIRKHIIFTGVVQGVGFRYYSIYKARSLGLTGWVQNLPDGTVEMEVQGRTVEIDELIHFLKNRPLVEIRRMDAKTIPLLDDEETFTEPDY